MRTKSEIIQAIINNDRNDKIYIHPVLTPEKAAKYISAFSNGSGGDIIFGIRDDGYTLTLKNYSIPFQIKKAMALLNLNVNYIFENFKFENKKFCYISIDKSNELVKSNNIPYKINKDGDVEEMTIKNVFISYTHKDGDLVDILEGEIGKCENIKITRDINATAYRDNLDKFMKTILEHDFVISVVSSAYIKSLNCMYEVMNLMQDKDYQEKLFFIIVSKDDVNYYSEKNRYDDFEAGIYDTKNRLEYVIYWRDKKIELEQSINKAALPPELMVNLALDMRKLNSVIPSMDDFIKLLSDKVGRSFEEMYKYDFKEIIETINR